MNAKNIFSAQMVIAILEGARKLVATMRDGSDAERLGLLRGSWEQHAEEWRALSNGDTADMNLFPAYVGSFRVLDLYFKLGGDWGKMIGCLDEQLISARGDLYRLETIHGAQNGRRSTSSN